jgi:hypothetical protein
LFTLAGLGVRDKQTPPREVDMIPARREDFHVPHAGPERDCHKQPKVRVGAGDRRR